jgi:hypothetical protein
MVLTATALELNSLIAESDAFCFQEDCGSANNTASSGKIFSPFRMI